MKTKRFLAALPGRLCLIIVAAIILIFFSNDFGLVDIQKTAIVLAVGIDRDGEDFALTAQIAVPKGSDRTTGGTSSVEIEGRGATVPDCISDIYAKTGWVPKLVFCNLVLLGESAVQENIFPCLDFFLRNEYIPNSCQLAACEGSAGEMLSTTSAIDDTSALALSKLFSDAAKKSGYVMTTTLREFAVGYYGVSGSGYMPYVRAQAQEGSSSGGSSGGSSSSAGSSGSSDRSGGAGAQEEKVYSAEETAIFSGGRLAAILPREQTFAFSLLEGNVYTGSFQADGQTYVVLKNGGSVGLELADVPTATLSLELRVQLYGTREASSPEEIAKSMLTPEQEARAEEVLTGYLSDLWDTCVQTGCDLFELRTKLYRASLAEYGQWKDSILDAPVKIEATIKSVS